MQPFGVYVHVPYCIRRCGYCAFTTYAVGEGASDDSASSAAARSVLRNAPSGVHSAGQNDRGGGDRPVPDAYVRSVIAELDRAADRVGHRALTSIYLGGGTPTLLADDQIAGLLAAVTSRFPPVDDLEVTIEANPDGLRDGQLAAMRELGATRVSFGMQSLSRRVLRLLDRTHDPERALAAVGEARAAGFEHISLDLIYGTPGETPRDWADTLAAVRATDVDHVSAYALGVEPATKLAARVRRGELLEPSDGDAADRYLVADELLGDAGFEWYEVSNWARAPAARCRHNQLYWRGEDWWGVGPGAHSHLAGTRWSNVCSVDDWIRSVRDGLSTVEGHEVLDASQRELERVMLGIRVPEGLPLDGLDEQCLERLRADGLVDMSSGRLVLTRQGRLLADVVVRAVVTAGPS